MSNTKAASPRSLTARWLLWMTAVAVTAGVVTASKLCWYKPRSSSRTRECPTREDPLSWPASTRTQDTADTATASHYDSEAPAHAAAADDAGWLALLESSRHDSEVPAHAA